MALLSSMRSPRVDGPGRASTASIRRRASPGALRQDHRRGQVPRLEVDREVRVALRGAALERLARLGQAPEVVQRAAELEPQLGPPVRVGLQADGRLEVLSCVRPSGLDLGPPELGQHVRARGRWRRLAPRALEVAGCGFRHAVGHRLAGGRPQALDHEPVTGRRRLEQVRGDLLAGRAVLGQQSRGLAVGQRAVGPCERVVDRRPDQRVHEAERVAGARDVRARELVGGGERVDRVEHGERRRQVQRHLVLGHRDRAGQRLGGGRELGEPCEHRARQRARGAIRCGPQVGAAVLRDGGQQLAHVQRVPARELEAAHAAAIVGAGEAPPHEIGDRGFAQRLQLEHRCCRPRGELLGQPALAAAGGGEHGDRLVVEPPDQVEQEPQRRLVGPLRVVDHEQQRLALRGADGQPVEAMQDPKRIRGHRRRLEQCARRRRRAVEHLGALGLRTGQQPRLEQRSRDAPAEAALQLVPARAQDEQALLRRKRHRPRGQRRLAQTRRRLDHQRPSATGASIGQQRLHGRDLTRPFEERLDGRAHAAQHPTPSGVRPFCTATDRICTTTEGSDPFARLANL